MKKYLYKLKVNKYYWPKIYKKKIILFIIYIFIIKVSTKIGFIYGDLCNKQ